MTADFKSVSTESLYGIFLLSLAQINSGHHYIQMPTVTQKFNYEIPYVSQHLEKHLKLLLPLGDMPAMTAFSKRHSHARGMTEYNLNIIRILINDWAIFERFASQMLTRDNSLRKAAKCCRKRMYANSAISFLEEPRQGILTEFSSGEWGKDPVWRVVGSTKWNKKGKMGSLYIIIL